RDDPTHVEARVERLLEEPDLDGEVPLQARVNPALEVEEPLRGIDEAAHAAGDVEERDLVELEAATELEVVGVLVHPVRVEERDLEAEHGHVQLGGPADGQRERVEGPAGERGQLVPHVVREIVRLAWG